MVDPEESAASGSAELTLSQPEEQILRSLKSSGAPLGEEELAPASGLPADTLRGSLQRLRSKRLLDVEEEHRTGYRITERGSVARSAGLPERRLARLLASAPGGLDPTALGASGLTEEECSVAIGVLRRRGLLEPGVPLRLRPNVDPGAPTPEEQALDRIAGGERPDEGALPALVRRGLVEVLHSTLRRWRLSKEGAALELERSRGPMIGALTPALLTDGGWRGASFRPYDVRAVVPYRTGPEPHPYAQFLEEFAEILVGLGFEEAEGPLVETEFWNNDVLYMPQEHPARSVHDAFSLRDVVGRITDPALLERVAAAHEGRPLPGTAHPLSRGWRVPYRTDIAERAVLRSQTTAVSARYLARKPEPPFRMFCLDRNFRPESLDASHHIEFAQCEGILGEEGISVRDLIGIFRELAEGIGIRELKLRPSYFPFTEPSVEAYVRHPQLGWIEVFPGGLFRPEVLGPLGIEVPVAAWGIGVTRLAMVALHVNDIRELFSDDLGRLTGRGA